MAQLSMSKIFKEFVNKKSNTFSVSAIYIIYYSELRIFIISILKKQNKKKTIIRLGIKHNY